MEERRNTPERKRYRRRRAQLQNLIGILAIVLLIVLAVALFSGPDRDLDSDVSVTKGDVTLELMGNSVIIAEFGGDWTIPDARVLYKGESVQVPITVDQPEMDTPGEYTVTYTAKYKMRTLTLACTVHLRDTTAPEISLITDPNYFPEYGEEYQEEGFSAYDLADGDVTAKVERRVEGNKVYYTVTDSAGNTAAAERTVHYTDRTAPVLTLLGDASVTVDYAADYSEPGFTALDGVDGDLYAAVTVIGEVNPYISGTYTLTYTVTDAAGNVSTAQRTVTVGPAPQPEPDDRKVIYLTFDDGPGKYTPELLAVLEKYNVKATFFVVGTAHLEYLDEIAAAGHSIGVHTDTHEYSKIYSGETAFWEDFNAICRKIADITGSWPTISRFPGGSTSSTGNKCTPGIMAKLRRQVTDKGYRYFDWNVDSGDAVGAKTADEVYNNVIAGIGTKKMAVVLQHDIKSYSVDAVERIIQWGLANGYTFESLDENSPNCSHGG